MFGVQACSTTRTVILFHVENWRIQNQGFTKSMFLMFWSIIVPVNRQQIVFISEIPFQQCCITLAVSTEPVAEGKSKANQSVSLNLSTWDDFFCLFYSRWEMSDLLCMYSGKICMHHSWINVALRTHLTKCIFILPGCSMTCQVASAEAFCNGGDSCCDALGCRVTKLIPLCNFSLFVTVLRVGICGLVFKYW